MSLVIKQLGDGPLEALASTCELVLMKGNGRAVCAKRAPEGGEGGQVALQTAGSVGTNGARASGAGAPHVITAS